MLNDRLELAQKVASGIKGIEARLNDTMIEVGTLLVSIPEARARLGNSVPLEAGVEATESLAALVGNLAAGYRHVVEAHRHLAEDRDRLGLRTISWGDMQACPPKASADAAVVPLRSVEAA